MLSSHLKRSNTMNKKRCAETARRSSNRSCDDQADPKHSEDPNQGHAEADEVEAQVATDAAPRQRSDPAGRTASESTVALEAYRTSPGHEVGNTASRRRAARGRQRALQQSHPSGRHAAVPLARLPEPAQLRGSEHNPTAPLRVHSESTEERA